MKSEGGSIIDWIAALGRFMLKSEDKCHPFFCILRKYAPFTWH